MLDYSTVWMALARYCQSQVSIVDTSFRCLSYVRDLAHQSFVNGSVTYMCVLIECSGPMMWIHFWKEHE